MKSFFVESTKIVFASTCIFVVMLSMYFTGVGAAQPLGDTGPPLTLYELDQNGKIVPAAQNVFASGQEIWIGIPAARSGSYQLAAIDSNNVQVASDLGNSIPSNNMIPYSLSPSHFSPNHAYQFQLKGSVQTSPGFSVIQTSTAPFYLTPGNAHLELRNWHHQTGSSQADLSLLDVNNNPSTGVPLGLILHYGNSSLQVTSETTDLQGQASFQIGESLGAGKYRLEVKILDQEAVAGKELQLPAFDVAAKQTSLTGTFSATGQITAALLASSNQKPIQGRLLALEKQLKDGNWTILSVAYTDKVGKASFSSTPPATLRVAFRGDDFYGPSILQLSTGTTSSSSTSVPAQKQIPPSLPKTFSSSFVSPACPCACPNGRFSLAAVSPNCGGGGGGGTVATTTTAYPPSSAYATIPVTLAAAVRTTTGTPLSGMTVYFYYDSSNLLGTAITNSTGYASFAWTPGLTGSHTMTASFFGSGSYLASSGSASLAINQTPTTVQILQPSEIAYAWDLYFSQSPFGMPIVVPVNILALAASGNGSPSGTYTPTTNGVSTTPANIPGFGWTGLNLVSTVSMSYNTTFTEIQNMTWTRNFYLPPCPGAFSCLTSPRTGRMSLTASLSPPNTLYTSSSTSLSIPYQNLNSLKTGGSGQIVQSAPPPKHVYVNVNATYPYLSLQMQGLSVGLQSYYAFVAYLLQQNPTATVQCNPTCINVYSLPVISLNRGTDFAYACSNTSCTSVPTNATMYLYNSSGRLCTTTRTDYGGVASLNVTGVSGCSYPYYYVGTSSVSITVSGLYATEAFTASPFYTNFQGYNYATYAPLRTGPYLLHMFTQYYNAPYTVLYPSTSYPDVAYPYYSCCDIFYNVEKQTTNATITVYPGTGANIATVRDNLNATVILTDSAAHKALGNVLVNYNLTMTSPGSGVLILGSKSSNVDGTVTINLGQQAFGSYVLTISWPGNSTTSGINTSVGFTVYKTRPTLILRNVQEPVITYIHPSGGGPGNSPNIDGSAQAYCPNNTRQCKATLTTTQNNDIIIVYTVERLNNNNILCTFSVSDTAGLSWKSRTVSINGNGNRDQLQEFWAQSPGILTADAITESIGTACDSSYGGNYNGLIAFGVSGANYNSPFDPNTGVLGWKTGQGGSPSVAISSSSANDVIFAGILLGASPPATQSGFTTLIDGPGFSTASEYAVETSKVSSLGVGFGDTAGTTWMMIADGIQGPITPSILPATGSPYRFYTYVGDDRSLQVGNWSCSSPTYTNCVILQGFVGQSPASMSRWLLYYWSGHTSAYYGESNYCYFTSCSPTWSTAPSSFCNGAPYCYYFAVDICCFSSIINNFIQFSVNAFDIAGQSPVFGSYSTGYGFVDNPYGSFIVNGNKVRSSDIVNATSNAETFQFNATQSPNLITSVSVIVTNMTGGATRNICLIGPGCLQAAQTTSQSFLLYPASSLTFSNGAYSVTAYFTCSTCPNLQYRVMSIMLQFGGAGVLASTQSPWIQGATALNPYYFRTYLYDNATQSLIAVSGLSENVYVNGTLLGSYTTNSPGNVFFPWTPAISALYKIQATFLSQNYYTSSNFTTLISVQLRGLVLAVTSSPSNPDVNTSVSWTVTAEDMVTKSPVAGISISQYLDGTQSGQPVVTDSSGNAGFAYSFTSTGRHDVTFLSQATQVYNSAKSSNPLIVFLSTKSSLTGGTVTVGLQNTLSVKLMDINGAPLPGPGRTVTIRINSAFYQNVTTDGNGNAQFTWRPDNTGTYTLTANYYAGGTSDIGYRPSAATLRVTVAPQIVTNTQSTGSGTQSLTMPTASGTPQAGGLGVSVTFPSLGWVNVNIQFGNQYFTGSLHIWNEFNTQCVAWVWGVCVFVVPIWRVHFDANVGISGATFNLITDFFTGAVQTSVGAMNGAKAVYTHLADPSVNGANSIHAAFLAASAVYLGILISTGGTGEPTAAPAAVGVLLAIVLATGIAAFLAYNDKQSREDFLWAELSGVGMDIFWDYVNDKAGSPPAANQQPSCDWCVPLLDVGSGIYMNEIRTASPWGRVVLVTGLVTVLLCLLLVVLMVHFMT